MDPIAEASSRQVFVVFQVFGEGDGDTMFSMKGIYSSMLKAKDRAATLVVQMAKHDPFIRKGNAYLGLPEKLASDFTSPGYTIMSRSDLESICDDYGYGTKSGFLIESCNIDEE